MQVKQEESRIHTVPWQAKAEKREVTLPFIHLQYFLRFFSGNGYKIVLKCFITDEFINVEDIMRIKYITINLFFTFSPL